MSPIRQEKTTVTGSVFTAANQAEHLTKTSTLLSRPPQKLEKKLIDAVSVVQP
jgi:hypothetical protein